MPETVPLVGVIPQGGEVPPGLDALEGRARVAPLRTPAEFADALPDLEALAVYDFRTALLRDADWSRAGKIAWIHAASAGLDAVMVPGVVERDIAITNSRGLFDRGIAEYVLGLMLLACKDFHGTLRYQRERRWVHRDSQLIRDKRLLVVGTGSIGTTIGELAAAAGVEIEGIARDERDQPPFSRVLGQDDLHDRLGWADFVVISAPLTDETRGMFDSAAFRAMQPHAWLINIGRGPIVDEPALIEALRSGAIAGAGLDVFETEPLPPESPLWQMENVVVSPHMSGDFDGWVEALSDLFVDNFERWQRGEPLRNRVETEGSAAGSSTRR